MKHTQFDEFIEQEVQEKSKPIDWETKKVEYLGHIKTLFGDVREWLKEYTQNNKITIEDAIIRIDEEIIGVYEVPKLKITIGSKIAELIPIGTNLIGTKGRVDLVGDRRKSKFILADRSAKGFTTQSSGNNKPKKPTSNINWVWKITSNPPQIVYTELNKDSFLKCLMEVLNG